eukprot:720117-Rhodomonas_salina.1
MSRLLFPARHPRQKDSDACVLWPVRAPPTEGNHLGKWEMGTRGVASHMMRRMGYIPGCGLGTDGEGKERRVSMSRALAV